MSSLGMVQVEISGAGLLTLIVGETRTEYPGLRLGTMEWGYGRSSTLEVHLYDLHDETLDSLARLRDFLADSGWVIQLCHDPGPVLHWGW